MRVIGIAENWSWWAGAVMSNKRERMAEAGAEAHLTCMEGSQPPWIKSILDVMWFPNILSLFYTEISLLKETRFSKAGIFRKSKPQGIMPGMWWSSNVGWITFIFQRERLESKSLVLNFPSLSLSLSPTPLPPILNHLLNRKSNGSNLVPLGSST